MTTRDYVDQASLPVLILMVSGMSVLWSGHAWFGILVTMFATALLGAATMIPNSFFKRRVGIRRLERTLHGSWILIASVWASLQLLAPQETIMLIAKWVTLVTLAPLMFWMSYEIEGTAHGASWRDRRNEEG